jgi:cell division protein FtsL
MRESRSEYAFTRPVVNTYLVRERDRRLLRELALVVFVVLCLGGGLLAYTWMHLEVLDTGYRIVDLERRLRDLAQEERRLQLESAYLASPPHIESRAATELGMKGPEMDQVIFSEELGTTAATAANTANTANTALATAVPTALVVPAAPSPGRVH